MRGVTTLSERRSSHFLVNKTTSGNQFSTSRPSATAWRCSPTAISWRPGPAAAFRPHLRPASPARRAGSRTTSSTCRRSPPSQRHRRLGKPAAGAQRLPGRRDILRRPRRKRCRRWQVGDRRSGADCRARRNAAAHDTAVALYRQLHPACRCGHDRHASSGRCGNRHPDDGATIAVAIVPDTRRSRSTDRRAATRTPPSPAPSRRPTRKAHR